MREKFGGEIRNIGTNYLPGYLPSFFNNDNQINQFNQW